MTSRRIRTAAAISLLGAMLLILGSIHRSGQTPPFLADQRTEKSRGPSTTEEVFLDPSQTNASASPARPSAIVSSPDYESDEFTHVPDWMPRPGKSVSARAEDASLRSDGFVEGTLRFVFAADQTGALHEITTHLKAAGMKADAGRLFARFKATRP